MPSPLLATICAVLLGSAPVDDPAVAALSAPERRMLDPQRERMLQPDLILDSLGLRGDEHVADVGAGPGFFTLRFATRVPRGRVVATDIDAAALAAVAARAAAAGIANVEIRRVPADDPGLGDGTQDVIFLCQVDHYLADRTRYFGALRRALRPHGRLVLVNLGQYRELDRTAALAAGFKLAHDGVALSTAGVFVMICDS